MRSRPLWVKIEPPAHWLSTRIFDVHAPDAGFRLDAQRARHCLVVRRAIFGKGKRATAVMDCAIGHSTPRTPSTRTGRKRLTRPGVSVNNALLKWTVFDGSGAPDGVA